MMVILPILGLILMLFGLVVSVIFWIPAIFDRNRVKMIMGRRYPLVYLIYIANGPLLVLFGFLLFIWPRM